MAEEKNGAFRPFLRRRTGRPSSQNQKATHRREGGGREWVFIVVGSLTLTLVAFVCGARMGKALSEWKPFSERAVSVRIDEAKNPPPAPLETQKEVRPEEPKEGAEGMIPLAPEKQKERALKAPQTGQKVLDEKIAGSGGAPPPLKKNKFTLQVAALQNAEEARQMVEALRAKGYEAYQISGKGEAKGTLHRVRVGRFASLQEARQFALSFEKKEKMKTIITGL